MYVAQYQIIYNAEHVRSVVYVRNRMYDMMYALCAMYVAYVTRTVYVKYALHVMYVKHALHVIYVMHVMSVCNVNRGCNACNVCNTGLKCMHSFRDMCNVCMRICMYVM